MTITLDQVLTLVGLCIVGFGALWSQRMAMLSAISKVDVNANSRINNVQAETFTSIQRVELKLMQQELDFNEKFATNATLTKTEDKLIHSIDALRGEIREWRDAIISRREKQG